jgi:predicted HAD superfamily Cof-like phosphohydrolase
MSEKSNFELVKEFTEASGYPIPPKPVPMTRQSVEFIVCMVLDECAELIHTVSEPDEDVLATMRRLVGKNYKPLPPPVDEIDMITQQADALVDINYYNYNCAAKHNMDIDAVFKIVHQANMDKRFPDGTFHRDQSGKIIKPPTWKEPAVEAEMRRQLGE